MEDKAPDITAETYVFQIAGTNVAFLDRDRARYFVNDHVELAALATPPAIIRLPAGYLAPSTKIVWGQMPSEMPEAEQPSVAAPEQRTIKAAKSKKRKSEND